ncbi:MAG: DUF1289 domain-containing protein [Pseudomonadales bacterium]|nr:DUF1289 domain-containing protein [Pseudomonadales bacterium]
MARFQKIDTKHTVTSPCVRNCCLNPDDVCIGCGRTLEEIKSWTSYSDAEKKRILQEAEQRLTTLTNRLL